ncbi:MAG: peptidoglycan DD-metalloendopeptidase family protein [Bacteroidales bacterium]|nr:peptidoglycan DD-metalloendopeptidase family protein [Bacteroidales bacterium]
MNRLCRPMLRLLPLLVALLLFALPAEGQNKKQLERDKAKIEKEIERLTNELGKARKNSKNSTKQINLIKSRIQERTRLIDNINGQMNMLDRQIVRTEDSLRVVRGQIDSMKAEYARVVRTLYGLKQNLNSTGLLLDNEQYNYSYLKMKYFAEYSRFRKHQATAIRRREQLFNDMSLDLQRQRKEKTSLLAQERKQRDALSREQQQQQKKLNQSQQDEKSLQQQISKKEKQKRQLQQQIQQLINAEVAKSEGGGAKSSGGGTGTAKGSGSSSGGGKVYSDAASSDFVQNKGRLPWPVYYKSVAREYGLYTHSSGGQNRNYGIDLNCAPGATVSAVFAGTVARVATSPAGTKVVIVRHGAYMTVYAGLGTVSVSQGSKVGARQTLGTVYVGDEATSEFSFQVWCGKDALNPRHWLK